MAGNYADELRIILIGKTGSGKSSTANAILGKEKFTARLAFDSQTRVMQYETETRFGKDLHVVDTPGLFDTKEDISNEDIWIEIQKSLLAVTPGPHAIILVIRIGRYGKEDRDTANFFCQCFGKAMLSHLFVIFTGAGELKGENIHTLLKKTQQKDIKTLLENCNDRIIGFDQNTADDSQVRKLIEMIEQNINRNRGMYYSNNMFKDLTKKIEDEHMTTQQVVQEVTNETSFGETFVKEIAAPIFQKIYSFFKIGAAAIF